MVCSALRVRTCIRWLSRRLAHAQTLFGSRSDACFNDCTVSKIVMTLLVVLRHRRCMSRWSPCTKHSKAPSSCGLAPSVVAGDASRRSLANLLLVVWCLAVCWRLCIGVAALRCSCRRDRVLLLVGLDRLCEAGQSAAAGRRRAVDARLLFRLRAPPEVHRRHLRVAVQGLLKLLRKCPTSRQAAHEAAWPSSSCCGVMQGLANAWKPNQGTCFRRETRATSRVMLILRSRRCSNSFRVTCRPLDCFDTPEARRLSASGP